MDARRIFTFICVVASVGLYFVLERAFPSSAASSMLAQVDWSREGPPAIALALFCIAGVLWVQLHRLVQSNRAIAEQLAVRNARDDGALISS
jgi:hypothetical protein